MLLGRATNSPEQVYAFGVFYLPEPATQMHYEGDNAGPVMG